MHFATPTSLCILTILTMTASAPLPKNTPHQQTPLDVGVIDNLSPHMTPQVPDTNVTCQAADVGFVVGTSPPAATDTPVPPANAATSRKVRREAQSSNGVLAAEEAQGIPSGTNDIDGADPSDVGGVCSAADTDCVAKEKAKREAQASNGVLAAEQAQGIPANTNETAAATPPETGGVCPADDVDCVARDRRAKREAQSGQSPPMTGPPQNQTVCSAADVSCVIGRGARNIRAGLTRTSKA